MALLCLLLAFTVLLTAGVLIGGIYAGAVLDTELDETLFFESVGDKTTRLYYLNEQGEPIELTTDRISGFENALYCPLSEMSQDLIDAFVAIEDKRFYEHGGIDWIRTAMAVKDRLTGGGGHFGGSTITQQLVKNLTGETERSVKRKVAEMIRAARLEKRLTKDQILEQYLNVVNLAENCYGVRTASNAYFSKEPAALSLREAATIAAITNNPTRYDPIRNPEHNRRRRDVILRQMYEQGRIDEASYREAISEPTELKLDQSAFTGRINSWFADLVVRDVIDGLVQEKGMSEAAASRLVYSGGLKIYTTVDPRLQEALGRYYADHTHFPTHQNGERAQSAMMIVDPHSGNVLAVAGAVGEKKGNRLQSFATDARRPSGSVIKPLSVFAPALERGLITWSTVFDDVPADFRANGAPWPRNSPDVYRGLTNVNTAVVHSVNTVSVSVLQRLGHHSAYRFLTEKLEFHSLCEERDTGTAALALGQQHEGITLRELIGGYTALANGGLFTGTRSFTEVRNGRGEVLLQQEEKQKAVLAPETAAMMTMMLRQVVQSGTGRALQLKSKVDVAGKTGTSSFSCDKWFVGYTPELLAGVWYGHEYPKSLSDVKGNPALTIFDEVMQEAITLRAASKRQFETPENVIAVRFCKDSGKPMGEACRLDPRGDRAEIGYFKKGTEPQGTCDRHVLADYCDHGGVAGDDCPLECRHKIALIRVFRVFPRQIKVLDAPYTYGGYLPNSERNLSNNEPYYAKKSNSKQFYGIAMGEIPYNRSCTAAHKDEREFWHRRAGVS